MIFGSMSLVLVLRDRAARHDFQMGKLRKTIDQTAGDAVAEELRVGVRIGGGDGKNGDRIDCDLLAGMGGKEK